MKRNYLSGLIAITISGLLIISSVPVWAQDGGVQSSSDSPTPLAADTSSAEKQRADRITKLKEQAKTRLTAAQQERIKSRCKNAQTHLNKTIDKTTRAQTNRDKIHAGLVERLTILESKLSSTGLDTMELKNQIATLKSTIDTFKADTNTYIKTLQDTAVVDCQADPDAFKLSLEAARESLKKIHTDAVAIRTIFINDVKPHLAVLKQQLVTNKDLR